MIQRERKNALLTLSPTAAITVTRIILVGSGHDLAKSLLPLLHVYIIRLELAERRVLVLAATRHHRRRFYRLATCARRHTWQLTTPHRHTHLLLTATLTHVARQLVSSSCHCVLRPGTAFLLLRLQQTVDIEGALLALTFGDVRCL